MKPTELKPINWLSAFKEKLPETPFYAYSESRLTELWEMFHNDLESSAVPIKLHFPVKANNNPHLLNFYKNRNAGLDVVSGYELEFALNLGFSGDQIIFSGSGKTDQELKIALDANIKMICIESHSEFNRLKKLCQKHSKRARISFRVNPNVDAETHPYISTGLHNHKFGIEFENALNLYKEAKDSKEFDIVGLSSHIGSQIQKLSVYDETLEQLIDFSKKLNALDIKLQILNVGGGLGINYTQPELAPPFAQYSKFLKNAASEWKKLSTGDSHIISECGRALCAQAGIIVTKIIAIKKSPYKNFAIVDLSMTELMRPCLYQSEHFFKRVSESENSEQIEWQIAGPVCETTDVLVKKYHSSELSEGELFLVNQAGAYGFVMANHYNLRPTPSEWWINSQNKAIESRPRKSLYSP